MNIPFRTEMQGWKWYLFSFYFLNIVEDMTLSKSRENIIETSTARDEISIWILGYRVVLMLPLLCCMIKETLALAALRSVWLCWLVDQQLETSGKLDPRHQTWQNPLLECLSLMVMQLGELPCKRFLVPTYRTLWTQRMPFHLLYIWQSCNSRTDLGPIL